MTTQTLTRAERLRSLKVIRRLFERGRSGFVYPFRYLWLVDDPAECPNGNGAEPQGEFEGGVEVMFSVPKRFLKRANKRNLVRRRTKESYRLGKSGLIGLAGARRVRIALIYSTKKIHEYKTINNAVERILGEIGRNL